jgi:hypothetical protein
MIMDMQITPNLSLLTYYLHGMGLNLNWLLDSLNDNNCANSFVSYYIITTVGMYV